MPRRTQTKTKALAVRAEYDTLLSDAIHLLEEARQTAARVVNSVITTTYWHLGRRIVEWELSGEDRAAYGDRVIRQLAEDLSTRFGKGFKRSNLYQMRAFYLSHREIVQTASGQLTDTTEGTIVQISPGLFPLPWSHYVRLLSVKDAHARKFYESEALRGGWTVKQLDRQIGTSFYERTMLSKNKAAMLTKHNRARPEDQMSVEEQIKDPFVLEFLGLKDEYSESDMEEALITQLEQFLLELGGISHSLGGSGACAWAMRGIAWICCSFIAGCGVWW